MRPGGFAPAGEDVLLAGWPTRAIGAIADGVVIGLATYLVALASGMRPPTVVGRLNGYLYLDLAVGFLYSFAMLSRWGRTLGQAMMRIYTVDELQGRTPIGPSRAAVRSLVAGILTVVPLAAFVDLLWPLWDRRNQTLHDKAAGTVVLRQALPAL